MTTQEKIAVMQAYADGKQIQRITRNDDYDAKWMDLEVGIEPTWDWRCNQYRIKPETIRPKSWQEYCSQTTTEGKCYIDSEGDVVYYDKCKRLDDRYDKTTCNSEEEAEAFVALMQLRLLRKAWVGDWEPDWTTAYNPKYVIERNGHDVSTNIYFQYYRSLSFPTREMARDFLNCFRWLIEKAKDLF